MSYYLAIAGPHHVVFRQSNIFFFILYVHFYDYYQIRITENAVSLLNKLLNSHNLCPENVMLVKNIHHKRLKSEKVGLCPFELTIDYNAERKPAVIIEAKCVKCENMSCSKTQNSKCTNLKKQIGVEYLKENKKGIQFISVGCFCASPSSKEAKELAKPFPYRNKRA